MLAVDGSEGGGQLLRSSLALAAVTGRAVRVTDIRGSRPDPGLKPQHLAAVEAVTTACDATVENATLGSETLAFDPGDALDGRSPESDDLRVDVGTAGSVTLVADTLLPLAVRLDTAISAQLGGGTDVKWSPPVDYLQHVKCPSLEACGLDAAVEIERRGFYPAGGGELAVSIRPSTLSPIALPSQSIETPGSAVYAVASEALEDADVADRIAETAVRELANRGIDRDASATTTYVETDSPGAVVTIVAKPVGAGGSASRNSANHPQPRPRAGFAAYGERGVPSEDVATDAVDALERWYEGDAPVDAHLGDQLVVWLAIAGGSVRIPGVTDHVRTNVDLVRAFGYDVSIDDGTPSPAATLSAPTPSS